MKDIILFGAGKKGKVTANLLWDEGIKIYGFCDSYKSGVIETDRGGNTRLSFGICAGAQGTVSCNCNHCG